MEVFRLELNVKRRAYTFTNREDGGRPSGRWNHRLKAQREHAHRTDPRNLGRVLSSLNKLQKYVQVCRKLLLSRGINSFTLHNKGKTIYYAYYKILMS